MTRPWVAVVVATSFVTCSCGESVDSVTGPTAVTPTTEHFAGTLAVGQSRFYSFSVTQAGSATFMLASVTLFGSGIAVSTPLGLGLGVPQGTSCAVSARVDVTPALVAQLTQSIEPGVYCVEVADIGRLTAAVNFAVRFTHL
jgi:hypothetical protein